MKPVLAIDLGSSSVRAAVGMRDRDGMKMLGMAVVPSSGIDKGMVVDIDSAARATAAAVAEVSQKTGLSLGRAHVAISGASVETVMSDGHVTVISADHVITAADRQAVVDDAVRKAQVEQDRKVVHTLPVIFSIDGGAEVADPVGLAAGVLEARVLLVTALATSVKNAVEVVKRAGLEVTEVVLQPIAASWGVLEEEERSNVIVIDIGGGSTGAAAWKGGAPIFAGVFPVGGNHITRDIALGLKLQVEQAEEIKGEFGKAHANDVDEMDFIEISEGEEQRVISKRYLCQIIEARLDEVLELIKSTYDMLGAEGFVPARIALTGGSSMMSGFDELTHASFGLPVSIGSLRGIGGLSEEEQKPENAALVGLLLHSLTFDEEGTELGELPQTAAAELFGTLKTRFAEIIENKR